MVKVSSIFVCVIGGFLGIGGFAMAQDASANGLAWTASDSVSATDGTDAGRAADFFTATKILKSSGGEGPLVILSCSFNSNGHSAMSAGFQLDPQNTYENNPSRLLRTNSMSGILKVGEDRSAERFIYHSASSKIIPRDPTVARKLFNATAKAKPVTLKVKNKTHQIALPPVDATFKSFVKFCPITNGGDMDTSIFDGAVAREAAVQVQN